MPNWFYTDEFGQQQGPVSDSQLKVLVSRQIIRPDTPLETDSGKKGKAGQIRGLFPADPAPATQTAETFSPFNDPTLAAMLAEQVSDHPPQVPYYQPQPLQYGGGSYRGKSHAFADVFGLFLKPLVLITLGVIVAVIVGIVFSPSLFGDKNTRIAQQDYKDIDEYPDKNYDKNKDMEAEKVKFFRERRAENFDAWKKSAEKGCREAQFLLAICYEKGEGVEKVDVPVSMSWLKKAAEKGLPEAQFIYGMARIADPKTAGDLGVPQDTKEGLKMVRRAAEGGHIDAQMGLYGVYATGLVADIPKDMEEAVKWLLKAVDRKIDEKKPAEKEKILKAWYWLAGYYLSDEVKDYAEGVKWLRKAAEKGSPEAMMALAGCLQQGRGVEKNAEEAKQWIEKVKEIQGQGEQGRIRQEEERRAQEARRKAEQNRQESERRIQEIRQQGEQMRQDMERRRQEMQRQTPEERQTGQTVQQENERLAQESRDRAEPEQQTPQSPSQTQQQGEEAERRRQEMQQRTEQRRQEFEQRVQESRQRSEQRRQEMQQRRQQGN